MTLRTYIISRILLTIPMIFILLTTVFVIMRVLPGDPVLLHFEKAENPAAMAANAHRAWAGSASLAAIRELHSSAFSEETSASLCRIFPLSISRFSQRSPQP